ncbi:DUF397 domain-containing protein [Actinomadura fulvescens]|uniref:DUF397 domain-containing protein n=1 Tax=Actinomadura fulvescens TaxID=46160 RepID=A0ABN3QCW8_9ACTN
MEQLKWRKSSYTTSNGGACVELASLNDAVAVRDSKNPEGPVIFVHRAVLRRAIREAS